MKLTRSMVLVLLMSSQSGCYEYSSVSLRTAPVGTPVRVTLTDRGSVELAPLIGPQIQAVDGAISSASDSLVALRVSSVINRVGYTTTWSGEDIKVPVSFVSSVERRTLNRKKSWLVAGASVAATAAVGAAFSLLGGRSTGGTSSGGGPR